VNKVSKLTLSALGMIMTATLAQPTIARNQASGPNVESIVQSNFATRQADLRSLIFTAADAHQLSLSAAHSLFAQLDEIDAQTQQDLHRGGIGPAEADRLNNMFTAVTAQLGATAVQPPLGGYIFNPDAGASDGFVSPRLDAWRPGYQSWF
jgi:hypothetical protein